MEFNLEKVLNDCRVEGIQEDDVKELEEYNKCLLDFCDSKILCSILIDNKVQFECKPTLDDLYKITIIQ